jgi:hypothetical protein
VQIDSAVELCRRSIIFHFSNSVVLALQRAPVHVELPRGVFVALPALPPMLAKTNKGLNESVNTMERTSDRCAFTFEMTSTLSLQATRGLVRRRSSYSR